jgi:hypothetical protein
VHRPRLEGDCTRLCRTAKRKAPGFDLDWAAAAAAAAARAAPPELPCLPFTTRLQALRGIKNCVIGNKRQKLRYIQLGAVPLLVGVLAAADAGTDASQLVQAAAALGSFAASEEGLQVVLQSGGVPHLLRVLQSSGGDKVVEASVRALKAVCRVRAAASACACFCLSRPAGFLYSSQAHRWTARQAACAVACNSH